MHFSSSEKGRLLKFASSKAEVNFCRIIISMGAPREGAPGYMLIWSVLDVYLGRENWGKIVDRGAIWQAFAAMEINN